MVFNKFLLNILKMNTTLLFLMLLIFVNLEAIIDGKKIDEYLGSYKNFSGAILIVRNEKVILKKGYGCAQYEFDIPNSLSTRFPIASNTKSFTAVAIMQLQERKLLDVHDTLSKYIPDFNRGNAITIHHLLTHTSGIQNYYKKWTDICDGKTIEEMVTSIKSWPLEFEPGTKYSYCNTGYLLLAYIIEKVSGMKYQEFLLENIFKPLNMHASGSISTGLMVKNKASGYTIKNNELYTAPSIVSPIALVGNGDLYSSIEDLYVWTQALFSGKIVNIMSLSALLTAHVLMDDSPDRAHGYGWFIDKKFGKRVVGYSGALVGFLSMVMRFIDDGVTIIILSNVEDQNQFSKICEDIPAILCKKNV